MSDKKLEQEILALENELKQLETNASEILIGINAIKQRIANLKELAWNKQSKKESSQMYKVLKEDKTHTMVKSEVGNIKVDKDFMEKEIRKHLDNTNLRGMVTTKEMLSFPKVAKGVRAEYDERYKNYTWRVKANDGSIIRYGSREYKINGKDTNRLLTNYSETEYGERQGRGEQGQLRREFNDRDFLRPATQIIPQTPEKLETKKDENSIDKTIKEQEAFIEQMLLRQEGISSIPRAKDFLVKNTHTNNDANLSKNTKNHYKLRKH